MSTGQRTTAEAFARIAAAVFMLAALCGMGGRPETEKLVENGGYILLSGGREIVSLNPDTPFVPASTAKTVTALAALETLGRGYRFVTEFFLDHENRLYIRGHGDPFMVSEETRLIAAELKKAGVGQVTSIEIDGSLFDIPAAPPWTGATLNPYDAVNAALAVNFNTVFVKLENGRVVSAEEQTPTLPLMALFSDRLVPGEPQRFNVTSRGTGRGPEYAAQLFAAVLAEEGIRVNGGYGTAAVPSGLAPVLVHRSSRRLEDVIRAMLLYSNNFIANQLFLAMGMEKHGPPATWEKGRRAVQAFLAGTLPAAGSVRLVEGSGLSRNNRISCRDMVRVLERFRPYAGLLPRKNGTLVKSGTMTGVYSYAGYIQARDGLAPFVIILNQERNNRDAVLKKLAAAIRNPDNLP